MPIITADDLYTRIYQENINEITRDNSDIVDRAVSAGIQETKMYLSRYDLLALFGDDTTAPVVVDYFLKNICIDIAVWRLVLLSNPGIDYETAKSCYEMAARTLRDIQAGKAVPDGWPYRDTTGETAPQGNAVTASYNRKRRNSF